MRYINHLLKKRKARAFLEFRFPGPILPKLLSHILFTDVRDKVEHRPGVLEVTDEPETYPNDSGLTVKYLVLPLLLRHTPVQVSHFLFNAYHSRNPARIAHAAASQRNVIPLSSVLNECDGQEFTLGLDGHQRYVGIEVGEDLHNRRGGQLLFRFLRLGQPPSKGHLVGVIRSLQLVD